MHRTAMKHIPPPREVVAFAVNGMTGHVVVYDDKPLTEQLSQVFQFIGIDATFRQVPLKDAAWELYGGATDEHGELLPLPEWQ